MKAKLTMINVSTFTMRFAISLTILFSTHFIYASDFQTGQMAKGAPEELKHWGQMVGQWSTTEERLKPDGSGWQASKAADWDFFWAFDGWGIQDNYTSPPRSETMEDESKRQRGINLRIYNPVDKQWVLTWLTPALSKPQNFTASSTEEEIVMLSDKADAQGNYRRVTFFDINKLSFEWKLEWSKDKENWLEVYRIHGNKKNMVN
jgi:hypothetical protein